MTISYVSNTSTVALFIGTLPNVVNDSSWKLGTTGCFLASQASKVDCALSVCASAPNLTSAPATTKS